MDKLYTIVHKKVHKNYFTYLEKLVIYSAICLNRITAGQRVKTNIKISTEIGKIAGCLVNSLRKLAFKYKFLLFY